MMKHRVPFICQVTCERVNMGHDGVIGLPEFHTRFETYHHVRPESQSCQKTKDDFSHHQHHQKHGH